MKFFKLFIPLLFIFLYILLIITTIIFFSLQHQEFNTLSIVYLKDIFSKLHVTLIPNKPIVDYLISVVGFFLTALGFGFVVVQMSALNEQVNKQEEQYHKDSEFKNFLEATKMLTSVENKDNPTAQMSAMYLLYDFAKKYPANNLEKVMRVLNKYATYAIHPKPSIFTPEKTNYNNIFPDKKTINEWKEKGKPYQKSAITALELNKKLFVYAMESKIKINLSDIIIFDFDIEKDFNKKISNILFFWINKNSLSNIIGHYSPRAIFLHCNFSYDNKQFDFSTGHFYSRWFLIKKESIKNRIDINLSYFIGCDLKECDFSYSNLWGVTFIDCKLNNTKFNNAECLGSEFLGKSKLSKEQLEKMLFIDKNFFGKFSEYRNRKDKGVLEYGVILNREDCFKNSDEYEIFVKYKEEKNEEELK